MDIDHESDDGSRSSSGSSGSSRSSSSGSSSGSDDDGGCKWRQYTVQKGGTAYEALEDLHVNCRAAIRTLASASADKAIDVDIDIGHRNFDRYHTVLYVDEVLMCASVKKFTNAMREFPDDRVIRSLRISGLTMSGQVRDMFEWSKLETKHLLSFELRASLSNTEGQFWDVDYLAHILEVNTTLETLKLEGINFSDAGAMTRRFSNAMKDHLSLRSVSLAGFSFFWNKEGVLRSDDLFALIVNGAKDKEELVLGGDQILTCLFDELYFCRLKGILATNPLLKKITLKGARMGYKQDPNWRSGDKAENRYLETALIYEDLARALVTNTNLVSMTIEEDSIGAEGIAALWKVMYNPPRRFVRHNGEVKYGSLNSIADSNHTCVIQFDGKYLHQPWTWASSLSEKMPPNGFSAPGWDQGTSSSKKSKLQYALGARQHGNIRIHYLKDVPLGMMPSVLHLVQNSGVDASILLKNVFEVVKACVAPLLC